MTKYNDYFNYQITFEDKNHVETQTVTSQFLPGKGKDSWSAKYYAKQKVAEAMDGTTHAHIRRISRVRRR